MRVEPSGRVGEPCLVSDEAGSEEKRGQKGISGKKYGTNASLSGKR